MNLDSLYIKMAEAVTWLSINLTMTLVGKVFALLLIVWMFISFIKAHNDPDSAIDLNDLLVDESGKIGGSKMRINLAFIACTWVLIFYSLNGQLSEWLFAAYIGAFVYDRMKSRDAASTDAPVTLTKPAAITLTPAPKVTPIAPAVAHAPAPADDADEDDPDFVPKNLPAPPTAKQ